MGRGWYLRRAGFWLTSWVISCGYVLRGIKWGPHPRGESSHQVHLHSLAPWNERTRDFSYRFILLKVSLGMYVHAECDGVFVCVGVCVCESECVCLWMHFFHPKMGKVIKWNGECALHRDVWTHWWGLNFSGRRGANGIWLQSELIMMLPKWICNGYPWRWRTAQMVWHKY